MLPSSRVLAAGAAGREGQPVRFAAFFMPHGVNHGAYDIKGDNLDSLSQILTPLEYIKEYVNVFAGMRNASGGHGLGTSSFLTGNRPVKTADPANLNVGNASIDQVIGALCPGATLPTLELAQSPPRRGAASNDAGQRDALFGLHQHGANSLDLCGPCRTDRQRPQRHVELLDASFRQFDNHHFGIVAS